MSSFFDYLIVGAGSAGCVLADRLTTSGRHKVCLLEAGGSNRHPLIRVPAGYAATYHNPRFDWGYRTCPEPELGGRCVYWPRGLGLGGSSAINGMIYIRGHAVDYRRWAQAGAHGWSYEDVLPYFKKAECQERLDNEYHGTAGPLHVQDSRDRRSIHDAFIHAATELGMPRNPDFNGDDQAGAGYYQFNQRNGARWSSSDAYLSRASKRHNLRIETEAFAYQIVFDGKRAAGVKYSQNRRDKVADARHVVLCGGAINTPQLLELSGIGDSERLRNLGIPVVHHLPDVGENLQDHALAKVVYGSHAATSINREVQGWRLGVAAAKWFFRRQGPLSMGSAPCGGFAYTRDDIEAPDIQFLFASGATLYNTKGKIQALPVPAITCAVYQIRPESTGSVHIKSTNPSDLPEIQANYLSSDLDQTTLVRGLRLVAQIFEQKSMEPYTTNRLSPHERFDLDDDVALLAYIRADAGSAYHPTSTCAIGKVVDPKLSVYGIEALSVADASVMPNIVSGNTHAACVMIGEKASDLLLGNAHNQASQAGHSKLCL